MDCFTFKTGKRSYLETSPGDVSNCAPIAPVSGIIVNKNVCIDAGSPAFLSESWVWAQKYIFLGGLFSCFCFALFLL